MALLAPLFALAVQRNGDWTLQLSRTVAYQSLSLAAIALYVLAMIAGDQRDRARSAATHARIAADRLRVRIDRGRARPCCPSPWLRAWVKVKLAKHLFRHRYDYRAEWMRFTDTLGKPGEDAAPLDERIVKAVADLTDSPAGAAARARRRRAAARRGWNWDARALPGAGGDDALARLSRRRPAGSSSSMRCAPRPARSGRAAPCPAVDARCAGCLGAGAADPSRSARRARSCSRGRRSTARSTGRISTCCAIAGRQVGELSRRSARAGGAGRCAALRRVQPPLRLHHARHQESGQPVDARRAQCRTPCRQSRLPRRHGRDAAGFGRADERPARAPVAASCAAGAERTARGRAARRSSSASRRARRAPASDRAWSATAPRWRWPIRRGSNSCSAISSRMRSRRAPPAEPVTIAVAGRRRRSVGDRRDRSRLRHVAGVRPRQAVQAVRLVQARRLRHRRVRGAAARRGDGRQRRGRQPRGRRHALPRHAARAPRRHRPLEQAA